MMPSRPFFRRGEWIRYRHVEDGPVFVGEVITKQSHEIVSDEDRNVIKEVVTYAMRSVELYGPRGTCWFLDKLRLPADTYEVITDPEELAMISLALQGL